VRFANTTRRCPGLVALFGLLALAGAPLRADPGSLEVYGRLPGLENVALSPDGSRLAFIRTDADTRLLIVFSISDRKALHVFRLREAKVRILTWADDDNLMIFDSATGLPAGLIGPRHEWLMLDVYQVSKSRMRSVPRID